jgi:hypothetical protein
MAKKRKKSARKTRKKSAPPRKSAAKRKAARRKPDTKSKGVLAALATLIGTLGATEALRRKLSRRSPLDNE